MMFFLHTITLASLTLLVYMYAGYPLLLTVISLLFPAPPVRKREITPTISLIISCYNEESILEEKINNSLSLDYPKERLEIIVVSDGSTDRTDKIAQSYRDQGVRLIRQEGRLGKTMGLNLAVPQARGEILVFSDANAMYDKQALRRLAAPFTDDTVGYVVGEARYTDTGKTSAAATENTYWKYEIFIKKMESRLHSMVGGDGAIYAIRHFLYEPLKHTDINDFVNPLQIIAKGYRGIYEPEAICHEEAAGSFDKEFRRKRRIVNRAFSGLMRVKKVLNPMASGIFCFEIISHKLLRWFSPFFLMAMTIAANILALRGDPLGQALAAITDAGIILSIVGYLASRKDYSAPGIFFLPYYFTAVNIASLLGILQSFRGDVQVTWETVRSPEQQATPRYSSVHYLLAATVAIEAALFFFISVTTGILSAFSFLFWSIFAVINYVYWGYPLFLTLLATICRRRVSKKNILPSVTLLVCAYNEEEVIEEKIQNSLALDYPKDKLVIAIASDGSTDGTNAIIQPYADSQQILFFNYHQRQGKIGAIRATVPKLTSEIIVFSDANTMSSPDALKKIVRNFADPEVGGVSADVILQNEKTTFGDSESTYYRYERFIQQQESDIESIIGADGGMYAIRRDLYIAPSPQTILDDFVISMNIALQGYRLVYEPDAKAFEESIISHRTEFLRKSRVIAGCIQAIKQCEGIPGFDQPLLLFCYISHKLLRWLVPPLLVSLFFINTILFVSDPGLFIRLIFYAQLLFYCAAITGYLVKTTTQIPLLSTPFYFCLENGAALYGIYKGLFNKQKVTWKKFARGRTATN